MSNYILEVKIADKGTLYKGIEESTFGHMYYVLVDPNGNRKSFGWGYGRNPLIGGADNIRETDDTDYTETNKGKIHTVTFNITQEQYNILAKHGKNPIHERLFHNNDNLLSNSCVDYVFTGLHKAGLNRYGYEGKLRPIDNLSIIEEFKRGNFIVPITPYGIYKKLTESVDKINNLDITTTTETNLIPNADFAGLSAEKKAAFGADKLNESTKHKDLTSTAIVTDDTRIANHNLIRNEAIDIKPYEFNKNRPSLYYHSTKLVNAQGRPYKIANDPLVLDLNGNGVQVVNYNEKPVLFDIDNDGGSLEETGWVDARDGLLVRDLNGNGKIDNMSEVFSEYYAGRAGASGEEGEKRFKHGFKALSTKLPFFLPSHLM